MKNYDSYKTLALTASLSIIACLVIMFINMPSGLIALILCVVLNLIFFLNNKNRYDKINELNNYLSLVCSGNYDLDIDDNTEGELSILKNNLYKVIVLLRSSNEAVKKEKVSLSDSLADISHQLKTPLTSLMVMADLLKDEKDSEKRLGFIEIMENQLDKMNWLISTLLKLSKLDAGTANFNISELNISSIIAESLKPFIVTAGLKNISIKTQINDFTFKGDENWCAQAFENIIKNCLEHTQNGGEIEITASKNPIYNEIIISDNGCGIPPEELPHIFERFYHGKNSAKDSVGIGLAFSKAVINSLGGFIEAQSEVGRGTKFIIRFYNAVV